MRAADGVCARHVYVHVCMYATYGEFEMLHGLIIIDNFVYFWKWKKNIRLAGLLWYFSFLILSITCLSSPVCSGDTKVCQ